MRQCSTAVVAVIALAGFGAGCGGDGKDAATAKAVDTRTQASVARAAPDTPVADNAEADQSYAAADADSLTTKAPAPSAAKAVVEQADKPPEADFVSPGAPTDAEIAAELKQLDVIEKQARKRASSDGARAGDVTLNPDGTATAGPGVPEVVARVVAGANAIAKFPYVYGGGHGSFVDTAYDCSGSMSYAFAAGGLLKRTMVSGEFAKTGEPGPGKWITTYANGGHSFMVVGGLRFDTSGRSGPLGSRWQTATRSTKGFEARHPPGL